MNINLLLNELANSQESFVAIAYANLMNEKGPYSVTLFSENQNLPIMKPNAGIFAIEKALYQHDPLISTSISTAKYLKKSASKSKILYVWEPEWMFEKMDYIELYNVLNTPATLIAQNEFHAKAIFNISGRNADFLIPNFDLIEIVKQCNLL